MKDLKTFLKDAKPQMKYTIELGVRARGVQLLELTEKETKELLKENLDEVYLDWIDKKEYEFTVECQYLMSTVDRFSLTIKDENDNIVYESDNFNDLIDKTYDDNGDIQVTGWKFKGVKDGNYLTRVQVIKGCWYTGEFVLNEPFDKDKLYIVQDDEINEELLGDYVFPVYTLYYQKGGGYDMNRDQILLDFESDYGEQYYSTHLYKLTQGDWWHDLQK